MRRFLIEPLIRSLPVSHTYFSLDFRLKKFIEGVHVPSRYRHQHWLAAFNEEEIGVIASGPLRETAQSSPYDQLDTFFRENASKGEFHNDVLWSYLRTYCMDQVLAKVDRMSMAHGLEVRAPFLDHTIVEFVLNLPYEYKFRGMTGKYILKRLMSGRIPAKIINRRKKGFGIPIGRWLQKELLPLSHELLSREALEKSGMFNYRGVEKLLIEHESGAKDHRKKLWTLMAFQLWYNNWAR
ncbi:MAG: Asparagine synthetase [Parcubacteria group bacterium GW2011_GWA2_51_10]|nr:MAG: Asparagine synthetase [Parcubacteria group bacterium GW2011_GWA2_51_10]